MHYLEGHYYHIFNRGCNREPIFFMEDNYRYLLHRMKATISVYGVGIIAYCLMPNHYHLLVRQDTDRPLSDWLKAVFIGYTQAVNKQQNRRGTLFEGRARNKVIEKDEYLAHLICYIHLNPVVAGLAKKPEHWQYSNFLECVGQRDGTLYDRQFMNDHFGSTEAYRKFFQEYCQNSPLNEAMDEYLFST